MRHPKRDLQPPRAPPNKLARGFLRRLLEAWGNQYRLIPAYTVSHPACFCLLQLTAKLLTKSHGAFFEKAAEQSLIDSS